MINHWLYVSRSSVDVEGIDGTIQDIVTTSQQRNLALSVTGVLLYAFGYFSQLIEGPEPGLIQLRASIVKDSRHHDIVTLSEGPAPARRFSNWSLAYAGGSQYFGRDLERLIEQPELKGGEAIERIVRVMEEFAS
ncbi:MAG: BLUF domain-containing protein [Sphingomonadaceae bacterium]